MEPNDLTMRAAPPNRITALSIDGGGVKGYIPALLLKEIEKRTQKCSAELFDVIAGTSTGGMIALGLTVPSLEPGKYARFSACHIADCYQSQSKEVFSRTLWHETTTLDGMAGPKYTADGLDKVAQEYGGDTLLKDALTEIVIPSFEATRGTPWLFKRKTCRDHSPLSKLTMGEVLRCTTAAPTYFPPKEMKVDGETLAFIDGGMFANNPSVDLYSVAYDLFSNPGYDTFLSLGTGRTEYPVDPETAKTWGPIGWVAKGELINIFTLGPSENNNQAMSHILQAKGDNANYYRLQTEIPAKHAGLDDTNPDNLAFLKEKTEALIEEKNDKIEALCHKLEQHAQSKERRG